MLTPREKLFSSLNSKLVDYLLKIMEDILASQDSKRGLAEFRSRYWHYKDMSSELNLQNASLAIENLTQHIDWLKHEIIYLTTEYELVQLEPQSKNKSTDRSNPESPKAKSGEADPQNAQPDPHSEGAKEQIINILNSTVSYPVEADILPLYTSSAGQRV